MSVIEIVGLTFEFIGTILIAISVFKVHTNVMRERKIDKNIIEEIRKERYLTLVGIILIILGYLLQLLTRLT